MDIKLGLLLNYMDLKKLNVMPLQDTRLSFLESNRLVGLIRRRYLINVADSNSPRTSRSKHSEGPENR